MLINVQGQSFFISNLFLEILASCGANYNEAYFRIIDMPVSEAILHVWRWIELQRKINPQIDPLNKPLFNSSTFEKL